MRDPDFTEYSLSVLSIPVTSLGVGALEHPYWDLWSSCASYGPLPLKPLRLIWPPSSSSTLAASPRKQTPRMPLPKGRLGLRHFFVTRRLNNSRLLSNLNGRTSRKNSPERTSCRSLRWLLLVNEPFYSAWLTNGHYCSGKRAAGLLISVTYFQDLFRRPVLTTGRTFWDPHALVITST